MGFNYFGLIEDKYCYNVTLKKPIIVRLDGKGITKNLQINMLDESYGGFAYAMINTARDISEKYNALVSVSTDEINLIFYDSLVVYEMFKSTKVQKISSLISQEVFAIFNSYYKGNTVFFDARTFNVLDNKIKSYISYRSKTTFCVCNTYVAKRTMPVKDRHGVPLEKLCSILDERYPNIKRDYEYFKSGFIFFKGYKINKDKLLECDFINFNTILSCKDSIAYESIETKDSRNTSSDGLIIDIQDDDYEDFI